MSDEPTIGEQRAFSDAYDLIHHLCAEEKLGEMEVGLGVLTAALATLRRVLPEPEIAKILYECADDYATRR